MKFAMCNEFCEGWDFASACSLASIAGYDAIEIAPFAVAGSVYEIGEPDRQRLRAAARENGLEVVGLHWLLAHTQGLHMNHPDPQVRARTGDYLRAEIDLCSDLGGRIMVVGSPKQRDVLEGQSHGATWQRTVELFGELAPYADKRGVTLCIEPLAASETNFITSAEEGRRLVEEVSSPAFRLMLDVKAMCSEAQPIPQIIRECAPYLKHFHANDANLQGPGFGEVDFVPIAEALKQIGYDGYISVEVFDFSAGPDRIATESLRYLREVFLDAG